MYSHKLFRIYPRNQKQAKNFKKFFLAYSKKVNRLVSKYSVRVMTFGLKNGRSKISVVNISTLP